MRWLNGIGGWFWGVDIELIGEGRVGWEACDEERGFNGC